jgi:hypothetical protein
MSKPLPLLALALCLSLPAPFTPLSAQRSGTKSLQNRDYPLIGDLVTASPEEDLSPFSNPYSGWEIWAGKIYCNGKIFSVEDNTTAWGDDCPWFGGVLLDMYWKDIQPSDSASFSWAFMDSIVDYWYERGKTFNIRLWCTWDPGWHSGALSCVPEWAQKGVAGLMSKKTPSAWVPLYSDPSYEKVLWPRIKAFLQEFKKHYAGDKWSSFVLINNMGYGMWGEWWEGSNEGSPIIGTWGSPEKKRAVLERIIRDWYTVIDSSKYCHMAGCISCNEEFVKDTATAMDVLGYRSSLPFGAGLSVNGYEANNRANIPFRSQLIDRYAPTNPGIGESNWLYQGPVSITSENKYITGFLKDFVTSRNDIAHWYAVQSDYALMKKRDSTGIINGLKAGGIGYRFVLTSASWNNASPGGMVKITSVWANRNYGKLNAKAPVKWFLTGSDGKEYCSGIDSGPPMNRKGNFWRIEGEHPMSYDLAIPADLPPGKYDLRVAMINTTTNRIPYIRLAIKGKDAQGRYRLGTVTITKSKGI